MNVESVATHLEAGTRVGGCLSREQGFRLRQGLRRLQEMERAESVFFWGRLSGTKKDYYVAMTMNLKGVERFPLLRFFWSDDVVDFAPLPVVSEGEGRVLGQFNEYLTGEHDRILCRQEQVLREIHRVAHLVLRITAEAGLAPREAFTLDFANCVRLNPRFRLKGWGMGEFMALGPPPEEGSPVCREEFVHEEDMLGLTHFYRSLRWEGAVSFARVNTNYFGFLYFGFGVETRDLHFTRC